MLNTSGNTIAKPINDVGMSPTMNKYSQIAVAAIDNPLIINVLREIA